MIHRKAVLSLVLALVVAPATARAAPSDADRAQARELAYQAQAALEKQEYAIAADKFGRADTLYPAPTLALGLARARVGLGKLVAARETYLRIGREGAPAGASPQFQEAVEDAARELAALEPRIPRVILEVVGPPRAQLTVDGVALPNEVLGAPRPIDPGQHRLRASAAGFVAAERTFSVREGAQERVTVRLAREAFRAPSGPGAPPAADSRDDSPGPLRPIMKTSGVLLLVAGGVAIAGGAVTGGLAIHDHAVLQRDCPAGRCDEDKRGTLSNFETLSTLSTAGIVGGAAGLVAGTTLLVLAPAERSSEARTARVRPWVGAGSAGVAGRFW